MVHTIEPIEVFSGDHAMSVIDMILKGYTKGVSKGVTNIHTVDESTQSTTFWSEAEGSDYVVIGGRIFMNNVEVSIHDIPAI